MSTKKNVLIVSIVGLALSYVLNDPLRFGICFNEYTLSGHTYCKDDVQYIVSHLLLFLLFPLLPLSLFTFFLKDEVFQSWWRFAKWSVPTIVVFSYVINGSGGGGFGISSGAFNPVIIGFLYLVFFIVSFAIIIRATYRAAGQ